MSPDRPGRERQVEVYIEGMSGATPDVPVAYDRLEQAALEALDPDAYAYVAGGAGGEETIDANRRAFERWRIVPRMMRDVADRDLSVELLGQELPAPVLLAPIGVQSVVHDRGAEAVAEAAEEVGMPYVLSCLSSRTLEAVADAAPDVTRWFQVYGHTEPSVTSSLIDRAEAAGYDALVVTVDTPMLGWRERDIEQGYLPFLEGEGIANYVADPAFADLLDGEPDRDDLETVRTFIDVFGDPSLTWDEIEDIRRQTSLPLVVKGLLHPDDAREAVDRGADGVVVSNHGGRQVDGAIGALDALPGVVDELRGEAAVLLDSGIRRGADVVRAVALGADAVLLGRPYVYGLALEGADGVEAVCRNVLADLDLTLGLAGHAGFGTVDRSILVEGDE